MLLTSPSGNRESMLQRVIRQIKLSGLDDEVIVTTGINQKTLIEEQIDKNITVIAEPCKRDTFPAIFLSCAYLYSQGSHEDEIIIVLPCDSFVPDEYFSSLCKIVEGVNENVADMVLMGITPTYTSSKFGYIVPGEPISQHPKLMKVNSFIEKPDITEADHLIEKGALWNGGVYGFRLKYLLDAGLKKFGTTDYNKLISKYHELPKINFSYEILQKAKRTAVIRYSGEWKDIGTWNSLTTVLNDNIFGKVFSEDCTDTYVINELNLPLICMGCHNIIIATSKDGILVADRNQSENIKKLLENDL